MAVAVSPDASDPSAAVIASTDSWRRWVMNASISVPRCAVALSGDSCPRGRATSQVRHIGPCRRRRYATAGRLRPRWQRVRAPRLRWRCQLAQRRRDGWELLDEILTQLEELSCRVTGQHGAVLPQDRFDDARVRAPRKRDRCDHISAAAARFIPDDRMATFDWKRLYSSSSDNGTGINAHFSVVMTRQTSPARGCSSQLELLGFPLP